MVPLLRSDEKVRRVYLGFPGMSTGEPWRAMYAVGVFAGLRPGEIRSLQWDDVDFGSRLIHVRRGDDGPVKDGASRMVPLSPALSDVLLQWKEACPPPDDTPSAQCFPCTGHHGQRVCKDSMLAALDAAYTKANAEDGAGKLPRLTWYQSTRHSYGGRFVSNGGSLERLRVILGHSCAEVTLRYGHLVRGQFTEQERAIADVQLKDAKMLPLRKPRGA